MGFGELAWGVIMLMCVACLPSARHRIVCHGMPVMGVCAEVCYLPMLQVVSFLSMSLDDIAKAKQVRATFALFILLSAGSAMCHATRWSCESYKLPCPACTYIYILYIYCLYMLLIPSPVVATTSPYMMRWEHSLHLAKTRSLWQVQL